MITHTRKHSRTVTALAAIAALGVGLAGCGSANAAAGQTADSDTNVRTIVAITGASPAPFTFKDEQGNLTGQNIELTKAVFDKLPQYKLEWQVADGSAIFGNLDSGRAQIAVNNYAKNAEREAKYLFSDPLYKDKYVLEVPKNSPITKVDSLEDLAGKSALVEATGNVTTALQNWNKDNPDKTINLKYTASTSSLVQKLQQIEQGVADFALDDKPIFEYYTKNNNIDIKGLEVGAGVNDSVMKNPYSYLVFPKGEEQLVKDVNKALAEVIQDGTSAKIDQEWFGEDLSPEQ